MTELIHIVVSKLGEAEVPTINARDLHAFLENGDHFATWVKLRIEQYQFAEGVDFVTSSVSTEKGRPRVDYHLSLDMAKELAMVERSAKGKQARQYFIDCERRARAGGSVAATLADPAQLRQALLGYTERVIQLEGELAEAQPKVEFHDAVIAEPGEHSMQDAAKILGTGGNRLFKFLREKRVLRRNNLPYQTYINNGHFVVRITYHTQPNGQEIPGARTWVTSSGLVFLFRLIRESGGDSVTSPDQ